VLLAVIAVDVRRLPRPRGPRGIARRVRGWTAVLAAGLTRLGAAPRARRVLRHAARRPRRASPGRGARRRRSSAAINLRRYADGVGVACDETTSADDVVALLECFAGGELPFALDELTAADAPALPAGLGRTSAFLTHEVFHRTAPSTTCCATCTASRARTCR
jgi:glycine dehydrogenase